MRFNKKNKMNKAAARDVGRYGINGVRIDATNGKPVMVATDGRVLVSVPVEMEGSDAINGRAVTLSNDAFEAAAKSGGRVDLDDDGALVKGLKHPYVATEFPEWRNVVPKETANPVSISLTFSLLAKIADALDVTRANGGILSLTVDADNLNEDGEPLGSILVRPLEGDRGQEKPGFGLIMPYMRNVTAKRRKKGGRK